MSEVLKTISTDGKKQEITPTVSLKDYTIDHDVLVKKLYGPNARASVGSVQEVRDEDEEKHET